MKKTLLIFMLITLYGCSNNTINTTIPSTKKQNINKVLQLQKEMPISEDPKQLSDKPQSVCFNIDIDEYLTISNNKYNSKPIYGCIFSDQPSMNAALLRAGIYIHTNLGMVTDEQLFNSKLMTAVGGHDFNGKELAKYYKQATITNNYEPKYKKLKKIERIFKEKVIDQIIAKNKDNYIFFAIVNTKKV